MTQSYLFAGVGGYYASKQSGLAGVFRRDAADGSDWKHALSVSEICAIIFCRVRPDNVVNLCCKPLVRGLEVVSPMGLACK